MTLDEIREKVKDCEDIILADGFEAAFLGVGIQFNTEFAVYDRDKCIEILKTRDGMSGEEAEEFFSFNVTGAFVGPHTPVFLTRM
jgi:hypothetical protein